MSWCLYNYQLYKAKDDLCILDLGKILWISNFHLKLFAVRQLLLSTNKVQEKKRQSHVVQLPLHIFVWSDYFQLIFWIKFYSKLVPNFGLIFGSFFFLILCWYFLLRFVSPKSRLLRLLENPFKIVTQVNPSFLLWLDQVKRMCALNPLVYASIIFPVSWLKRSVMGSKMLQICPGMSSI